MKFILLENEEEFIEEYGIITGNLEEDYPDLFIPSTVEDILRVQEDAIKDGYLLDIITIFHILYSISDNPIHNPFLLDWKIIKNSYMNRISYKEIELDDYIAYDLKEIVGDIADGYTMNLSLNFSYNGHSYEELLKLNYDLRNYIIEKYN